MQHLGVEPGLLARRQIMWHRDYFTGHTLVSRANAVALDFEAEAADDLLWLIRANCIRSARGWRLRPEASGLP
jgi:hypothetical protein